MPREPQTGTPPPFNAGALQHSPVLRFENVKLLVDHAADALGNVQNHLGKRPHQGPCLALQRLLLGLVLAEQLLLGAEPIFFR